MFDLNKILVRLGRGGCRLRTPRGISFGGLYLRSLTKQSAPQLESEPLREILVLLRAMHCRQEKRVSPNLIEQSDQRFPLRLMEDPFAPIVKYTV